jgi:hypothetical protein
MEMRSEETERDEGDDEAPTARPMSKKAKRPAGRRCRPSTASAQRRNWLDEPVTDYKPFTAGSTKPCLPKICATKRSLPGSAPIWTNK